MDILIKCILIKKKRVAGSNIDGLTVYFDYMPGAFIKIFDF